MVLTVSYTLPDFENRDLHPALAAISDYYSGEGAELLAAAGERAESARGDYEVSTLSGLPFQATAEEMTFETSCQSERAICFTRQFYVNSVGAAHPSVFRMAELFDLTDGHRLTFTDCFTDSLAAADAAREAVLRSDAAAQLLAQGVSRADIQASFQPEHFYLTGEGFVFWYQPGELGAGNSPVELPVPYSALKEYLVEWIAS